ncbi:MAG: YraN family protein [Lachnospiraceae bacterium]
MTDKNTRRTGTEKEAQAALYLTERGFRIKEQNFRCRQGEIDIIGFDGEYLVFVEVKYRGSIAFDNPLAAVGTAKQRKICRVADYYRYRKGIPAEIPVRYDVVGILQEETVWIKNAFPHIYTRG